MALSDAVAYAVAHWTLDESSGTRADSVGSNDLTDNNTVGSSTGVFSNAADFVKGNAEYLSIADNTDISFGDIDVTIRCWVKLDGETYQNLDPILSKDGFSNGDYELYYDKTSNYFVFKVWGSSGHGDVGTVSATNFGQVTYGDWVLIHAWHDATSNEIGISINAGTANTASHSTGIYDSGADLRIGGRSWGQYWDGPIDDFVILKGYILDATERSEDYNSGTGIAFADWSSGGSTFTATVAATIGGVESSASATFAAPVYTATATPTTGTTAASASGTVVNPAYSATVVTATGTTSAEASATFAAPIYSATATPAIGSTAASASGTVVNPTYSATVAATSGTTSAAATATFAVETYSATVSPTTGTVASSASATFAAPVYTATATPTIGTTSVVVAASHTTPTYTASASLSTGTTEAAATAAFASGIFQATATPVIGAAESSASATFTAPVYTATVSPTTGTIVVLVTASFATSAHLATATPTTGGTESAAAATFSPGVKSAAAALISPAVTAAAAAANTTPVYSATAALVVGSTTAVISAAFDEFGFGPKNPFYSAYFYSRIVGLEEWNETS